MKQYDHSFLNVYHFNCRSLRCNFDEFTNVTDIIQDPMTIVGVTETWLRENENVYFGIPNFEFVGNCRKMKRGGGVGLYIHENLHFKRRTDLDVFCDCLESLFIEIHTKLKRCIVAVIYRPPNQNFTDFLGKNCAISGYNFKGEEGVHNYGRL